MASSNQKVEPCDICGDRGFPEVIITCSKCNVNREHVYCMRILLTEIPEVWLCESCQSKNGTTSRCKVNQASGMQASKRQQAVTTGKVKFLHEDEVIKLACNFPLKPIPASSTFLMTRRAYVGSKNVIPKARTEKVIPNVIPRNGVQKNQMTDQHASRLSSKGPMKEHRLVSERQVGALKPDREVFMARRSLPIVGSGAVAECNRSNVEKRNIQSIQENFNPHRKYLPSSICAWRGQFQILQAAASGEFYNGFEAQPPCVVNRKAYKLSNKMPSVLQLESLPALNLMTDVFQNDAPSLQDIALYFFPSDNNERSRKNLNSVFKFMNAEKSMLRSFIDGVELLVFTSNQLNQDSRGTIAAVNAGYFLWGVFRPKRIDNATERLPDTEPDDMDVDMIGGKDVVGRIDHIRKDKPWSLSQGSLEGTLLQSTSKTLLTSSQMNLCVGDKSVLCEELRKKTKSEPSSGPSSWNPVNKYYKSFDKLDVPPGFEAHVRGSVKPSKYKSGDNWN